jgi:hypothetical protein
LQIYDNYYREIQINTPMNDFGKINELDAGPNLASNVLCFVLFVRWVERYHSSCRVKVVYLLRRHSWRLCKLLSSTTDWGQDVIKRGCEISCNIALIGAGTSFTRGVCMVAIQNLMRLSYKLQSSSQSSFTAFIMMNI